MYSPATNLFQFSPSVLHFPFSLKKKKGWGGRNKRTRKKGERRIKKRRKMKGGREREREEKEVARRKGRRKESSGRF